VPCPAHRQRHRASLQAGEGSYPPCPLVFLTYGTYLPAAATSSNRKHLTGIISVHLLRPHASFGSPLNKGDWHIICISYVYMYVLYVYMYYSLLFSGTRSLEPGRNFLRVAISTGILYYTVVVWWAYRRAGTPVGGGQAETPCGRYSANGHKHMLAL
jgi:hypothetical protein